MIIVMVDPNFLSLRHARPARSRWQKGCQFLSSLLTMSKSSSSGCSRESLGEEDPGMSKARTGRYSLENLARVWDDTPEVRERLREGHHLMRHWCNQTKKDTNDPVTSIVANLKLNHFVLKPVMTLMRANSHLIPCVDNLMEEITVLFQRCKLQFNGDRVYHEAWAVRRLATLAKSQLWKDRSHT